MAIQFAAPELRADRAVVLAAVGQDSGAEQFPPLPVTALLLNRL